MSLLARIFLLVIAAIVPALAVETWNAFEARARRTAEIHDEARRLAGLVANDFGNQIEAIRASLNTISHTQAVLSALSGEPELCRAYLRRVLPEAPRLSGFAVVSPERQIVCSNDDMMPSQPPENSVGMRAVRSGRFEIGEFWIGSVTGVPTIAVAAPIKGEGSVRGAIAAGIKLDWISQRLAEVPLDIKSTIAIADRDGTFLARSREPEKFVGQKFRPEGMPYLTAPQPGTDEILGVDGTSRVVGYLPLGHAPEGFYVGVGLHKPTYLAPIQASFWRSFALIGAGLLISLIFAWLIAARGVRRPVGQMLETVERWRSGDLAARIPAGGPPELRRFGDVGNAMASELQRQRGILEEQVRERTADLETANARLRQEVSARERAETVLRHSQKMEAVAQLTGGLAHDFNNLLTAVIGSLELLRSRLEGDEKSLRLVRTALKGAERGAERTRSLLSFSRRQLLNPTAIDANKAITTFARFARGGLGSSARLALALEEGLPLCRADRAELEAALLNLCLNAKDAMPQGGTVTIRTGIASLDALELRGNEDARPGTFVAISIEDEGGGMSPETMEKAFEPFFTTKEVGKGTGLGLSQVFGFARQSHGHVTIESVPGVGTRVALFLPLEAEAKAALTGVEVARALDA
jgi:signal transduction histidine kinase